MRLVGLYTLAGLSWALFLGPLVGFSLLGFLFGFAWLFLFGDGPWPAATSWILPLVAVTGGLVAAVASFFLLSAYGRRRLVRKGDTAAGRRQAAVLAAVPLLLALLLLGRAWHEARQYESDMAKASAREAAFALRVAQRQKITSLAVTEESPGRFRVAAAFSGETAGEHRLSWQLDSSSRAQALLSGERSLDLSPGSNEIAFDFTREELAAAYREGLIPGRGKVLVEEAFHLKARLQPLLSESERAELPPGERARLDQGDSPLQERAEASFPLRFVIE